MTITLYGIPNCDTVKKARAWLDANGVAHAFHDYKRAGLPRELAARFVDALGWEVALNRSGTTFRKLPEAERTGIDRDRAIDLMLANPSIVRRPILDHDGALAAGFRPDDYAARFGR